MQKREYANMFEAEEYLWWYKSLRNVLQYYIQKYAKTSSKILDAGCGTGENMSFLNTLGYKNIQGIDLSKDGLAFCKKRGLKKVQYSSLTKIPFKDHEFDLIYSTDVIGSLKESERQKAVQELYRVLKPGGVVIIHCAAFEWLQSEHDVVVNVLHRFTAEELRELFYKFTPIKISCRFFFLFPLMSLVKKMKPAVTHKQARSDVNKPNITINTILLLIQSFEDILLRILNFPIGTSVLLVVKKQS